MMRVPSKPALAFPGALLSALALLLGTACSSTPVVAPSEETAAPGPTGDGSPASPGSNGAVAPDYQKQDYPAGPYGVGVGSIIEDLAFLGWRDPVASAYDVTKLETVRLSEFYNPDGARTHVKLIWINASARWCGVCRAELKDINTQGINAVFGAKGLQMVETLFEDNDYGPATPLDLKTWGEFRDHAIDFPLLVDPGFKLGAFFSSDATPLNMLVDARTMQIRDLTMGYSSDYWQRVDELLSRL